MNFWMKHLVCKAGIMTLLLGGVTACKTSDPITKDPNPASAENGQTVDEVEVRIIDKPIDVYTDAAILSPIYFGFDSDTLDAADKAMVEAVAQWMVENPEATLLLQGNTDREGTAEYNMELGARRAQAVKAYLGTLGVDAQRLSAESLGETNLAVDTENNVRHWRNRRVEFRVLGEEGEDENASM